MSVIRVIIFHGNQDFGTHSTEHEKDIFIPRSEVGFAESRESRTMLTPVCA